jgi:hypothetical protein
MECADVSHVDACCQNNSAQRRRFGKPCRGELLPDRVGFRPLHTAGHMPFTRNYNCGKPNLASTPNPDTEYGVYIYGRLICELSSIWKKGQCGEIVMSAQATASPPKSAVGSVDPLFGAVFGLALT